MKILIGADFIPTKLNAHLFNEKDTKKLFGKGLWEELRKADYRVFNLELPLINQGMPISKNGPNMKADPSSAQLYKKAGVDLFTLANNHIMDYGEEGLRSTYQTLDAAGISYFGCGDFMDDVAASFVLDRDGVKVGFYACVEHEFSCATEKMPGANPFDPVRSYDEVENLKKSCDYVIVLYHGGKEFYRYPSPQLRKNCRKFIEKGADAIICQHSHCVGCEEKYLEGIIVYGQGNFLFAEGDDEYWNTSLLIEFSDGDIRYIPLKKHNECVRLANKKDAEKILNDFLKRSAEIKDDDLVREKYDQFSNRLLDDYLWSVSGGKSFLMRLINKISGYRFFKYYIRKKFSDSDLLKLLNYIECESHREIIVTSLRNRIYERNTESNQGKVSKYK